MRVTTSATYRKFNSSLNSVHSKLNKSMNKISSGKAYESAKENPLAYYQGKKMDNQYQDIQTKLDLIPDIKSRIYQQEAGARSIQETLSTAQLKVEYIRNDTNNEDLTTVDTIKSDLLQKMHTMVNDLNAQYQDYYVYGGNDLSTAPFTLNAEGTKLIYSHVFPGETEPTSITLELKGTLNADDTYECSYILDSMTYFDPAQNATVATDDEGIILGKIRDAMSEKGVIDIGYGTIQDSSTLLDTFTGGLNLLTGINPDALSGYTDDQLMDRISNSAIGLIGQAVSVMNEYMEGDIVKEAFSSELGSIMDQMSMTAHYVTTVYSDLGNKYSVLETTETRLNALSDSIKTEYAEKLGADPYEAITEMYSHQYAYNAAQQLGSSILQSSLFDFMR